MEEMPLTPSACYGTGTVISMLLLLQPASCRMTPSSKHSCQKFGTDYLVSCACIARVNL